VLTIQNLAQTYARGAKALDGVNLEIGPGMFGLLGPNGAGKSTLMRCVATLQAPTSGSICFNDIDVIREPERLRRMLGYLPQDFGVYPRISLYDMLDHMAVLKGVTGRGERRETVETLLNQVNLWSQRRKFISGFSGGMRQRFGIAQALIGNPSLLIVDEPTAGLDPEERNRFLNLLAEVGERVVVILSTHIVEDVSELCRRMAIIAAGKIITSGTPSDLMATLKGRIWRKTIARADLARYRENYRVILSRLIGGETMIHIVSDADPGEGFVPVDPGLDDVYFWTLASSRRAA
jgi:ABC-type multidrug transport system ATPase subunit